MSVDIAYELARPLTRIKWRLVEKCVDLAALSRLFTETNEAMRRCAIPPTNGRDGGSEPSSDMRARTDSVIQRCGGFDAYGLPSTGLRLLRQERRWAGLAEDGGLLKIPLPGPGWGARDMTLPPAFHDGHLLVLPPRGDGQNGQPPRPRNPYILFRQAEGRRLSAHPGSQPPTQVTISHITQGMWHSLPGEEKAYWRALAAYDKRAHAFEYPNYKYSPSKPKKNKAGKEGQGNVEAPAVRGPARHRGELRNTPAGSSAAFVQPQPPVLQPGGTFSNFTFQIPPPALPAVETGSGSLFGVPGYSGTYAYPQATTAIHGFSTGPGGVQPADPISRSSRGIPSTIR
ncbi:hypothetical protein EVG20_g5204 [Dentipellis fragilis]|uniref:HMG box domain-containing protein n=1 Tax=Dentipellis fragilis TaxID=205917 RepID=A0A4Y9YU07_9AGAM|nr:hypothetical protein EVG20_g5204 [Dentipellis fragilis]